MKLSFLSILVGFSLFASPCHGLGCPWNMLMARTQELAVKLRKRAVGIEDLSSYFSFAELRNVAMHVAESYSPKENYIVGLGRSPFPITSFINQVRPRSATTVPISYRGRGIFDDPDAYSKGKDRERVFAILDRYFPKPDEMQGRAVVLLDYSATGGSIAKFYADVDAWKKKRGYQFQVRTLTFSAEDYRSSYGFDDSAALARQGFRGVETNGFSVIDQEKMGFAWYAETLKRFAPYASYSLASHFDRAVGVRPNGAFRVFENALHNDIERAMEADEGFRRAVEGLRD